MKTIGRLTSILSLVAVLLVAGCAAPTHGPVDPAEIEALTRGIIALGPDIDPEEAARAARISLEYARQLAREYQVTDPALIHNTKVNAGLRPRGLCWQWADDIEARLQQENFATLELHRAIANYGSILIDHSTVIVSRRGGTMFEGMVLDGWRHSGRLFWAPTLEDSRYDWVPRQVVFDDQLRRRGQL